MTTRWTFKKIDAALRGKVCDAKLNMLADIVVGEMTAREIVEKLINYRIWELHEEYADLYVLEDLLRLARLGDDQAFKEVISAVLREMERLLSLMRTGKRELAESATALEAASKRFRAPQREGLDPLKEMRDYIVPAKRGTEVLGWGILRQGLEQIDDLLERVLRVRANEEMIEGYAPESFIEAAIDRWLIALIEFTDERDIGVVTRGPIEAALPLIERIVLAHLPE